MDLTLRVWRQPGPDEAGDFKTYQVQDVSPDASFLERLTQTFERGPRELRQLVQEEDAPVRQADLARTRWTPAAHKAEPAARVMWRPTGTVVNERPLAQ